MGVPWFQLKSVKFSEPVITFSSNYVLYASMSNRVMVHLEALAPGVEQYPNDEIFLDVRGIDSCIGFEDLGRQLRERVRNGPGYRCRNGANKNAGKVSTMDFQRVATVWWRAGVNAKQYPPYGKTAVTAAGRANPVFIRKNFNVVLERTVRELNGESCISLEEAPPPNSR